MPINQWTPKKLQQSLLDNQPLLLLDVRAPHEFDYARIAGSQLMPLPQLPDRFHELPQHQDIVVICHHGVRSQQACLFLEHAGFQRLYNLIGGIDAWSVSCDPSVPRY
ncbi:MAG: rhodanese-like domain-containing protein [Methylomonas sp.]|jgi:rhodanese-related sulfurtransferase